MSSNVIQFAIRQDEPESRNRLPNQEVLNAGMHSLSKGELDDSSLQKPGRDELAYDLDHLSAMQLKRKYEATYSTWRNMKGRRVDGAKIHGEFMEFRSFLRHMGPRPPSYTLDRTDSNNPMYGPGLCRWLDARGQANNRRNTVFLTYKDERLPLTIWAERTHQSASTLHGRRKLGWDDEEIISGKRNKANSDSLSGDDAIALWRGTLDQRAELELRWQQTWKKTHNNRYEAYIPYLKHQYSEARNRHVAWLNKYEPEFGFYEEEDLLDRAKNYWARTLQEVKGEYAAFLHTAKQNELGEIKDRLRTLDKRRID